MVSCSTTRTPEIAITDPPKAEPKIEPTVSGLSGGFVSESGLRFEAIEFSKLSGWSTSDLDAAALSFLESCKKWSGFSSDRRLSTKLEYAGKIADWEQPCRDIEIALSSGAEVKTALEDSFIALQVTPTTDKSKLTGYFEPELQARYSPAAGFSKAVPGVPSDLVRAEPSKFDSRFSGGKIWGRLVNGELDFYPERKDIVDRHEKALGYANAGEVFYLQIQGSGRLKFPDGRVVRAAFAAHNHRPFMSIARHLIDTGEIEKHQAGMRSILNWMDQVGPVKAKAAMDVNPRYVWFHAEEITDPNKGPKGAQGVPLTPMASMAVDPRYYAYGMPIFIDTKIPSEPGDWKGESFQSLVIAQDTGGAIKGEIRGDLFFGWGAEAGGRAASMNHTVDMTVLLPKQLAKRMMISVQEQADG